MIRRAAWQCGAIAVPTWPRLRLRVSYNTDSGRERIERELDRLASSRRELRFDEVIYLAVQIADRIALLGARAVIFH